MNDKRDPRLLRLLGGDALMNLRKRLRLRYERGESASIFRLTGLTSAERAALAGLLGRPTSAATSMKLNSADLDEALCRANIANSLRDALEQLDGPIINRAELRAALQQQWENVRAGCADPRLAALFADTRGISLLKRLACNAPDAGGRLVEAVQAVLRHLPAHGVTRSQLAAHALGDAHALDQGRPEATLTLAVLRLQLNAMNSLLSEPTSRAKVQSPVLAVPACTGPVLNRTLARSLRFRKKSNAQASLETNERTNMQAEDSGSDGTSNESARAIWASAGVMVNELARPALFLNLPRNDMQNSRQTLSQPCYISLRELLRSPPSWNVAGRDVFVCENPNMVAIAADALGDRCAPLVCTDGMPGAAQRTLLLQLAHAGARLRYHGDFDWPGLRIGNWVIRDCGAKPWRYGASEYLEAASVIRITGRALGGEAVEAAWDAELAPAMRALGWAIDEEAIAGSLLQDLNVGG